MASGDWVDVDTFLLEATNSMAIGQLVAVENFSLFDAMSAVELGNPKMDASMTPSPSLESLLESGVAPIELKSSQVLAVMDQLMLMEATWHNGGSLAQTVYCCLYMLRPERAHDNLYLNAFCQTLRATSSEVRSLMFTGCVCEDEDFNPHAFGLPLDDTAGAPTAQKVSATMNLAIERLKNILKHGANSQTTTAQDGSASAAQVESEHVRPLLARLKFRHQFLEGILAMQRYSKQDLSDAAEHFKNALTQLDTVTSTFGSHGEPDCGFHEHVNRHLLGPAPPRQCKILTHEAALQYYQQLLNHLSKACAINEVTDYRGLQTFLEEFSRNNPGILSRSLLHLQINHKTRDAEGPSFPWSPDQSMMCSCMNIPDNPDLPQDLAMYLEQSLIAVGNYCQAMLLNRARLRRRLRSGLLDWHNLWTHATNAEVCPEVKELLKEKGWTWQPIDANGEETLGPLAFWVERETCYNMLMYLFLGMELQLYQPFEFVQIYWYCNYLLSLVLTHIKVLQQWSPVPIAPSLPASPAPGKSKTAQGSKKGAGARKAKKAEVASKPTGPTPEDVMRSNAAHLKELWMTELHRFMSDGMMRLMLGLQQVGVVPAGPAKYNSEQERFELRFRSFSQHVKPEPLPYEYFQTSTDCSQIAPETLLAYASDSFAQARKSAQVLVSSTSLAITPEQINQVKAMDRIAMHNLVAGNVVRQALGQNAELTATFNFSYHAFFPAVAVKRK